jgi:hypothetical protein
VALSDPVVHAGSSLDDAGENQKGEEGRLSRAA